MKVEAPEYEIKDKLAVNSSNYVVLVVDMQNDFVHPDGALYNPEAEATLGALANFIEQAQKNGVPVWYTQDTHREDDPEFDTWGEHCVENSWGWQIHDQLSPIPGTEIIEKDEYNAFYETILEEKLNSANKSGLIIAGTVANICVHYTAASAVLRGYDVIHPIDLISALTEFDYEASLHQANWLFQAQLVNSKNLGFS